MRRFATILLLVFLAAAAAAAYYDWVWWEPYNAIIPLLAIPVLGVLALVLATIRRGRPSALVLGAIALGVAVGHVAGPSRPAMVDTPGRMSVAFTAPFSVGGSVQTACFMDAAGMELQLSGDFRLQLIPPDPSAPSDLDQREVVNVYLTVGERWRRASRPDDAGLLLTVDRVAADAPGFRLLAGPDSILELSWTREGGNARFQRLIPDRAEPGAAAQFTDLEGVVEWTCA